MKHKRIGSLVATAAALLVWQAQARAAQNSTPVGFCAVTVPLASDAIISLPFNSTTPATLDAMFPAVLAGTSFLTSPSAGVRNTEVLALNQTSTNINKSPVATFYYISSGANIGWRKVGVGNTVNFGPSNLVSASYVLLRNKNTSQTNVLTYVPQGTVEQGPLDRSLFDTTVTNDFYVTTGRPVATTLDDLQIGGTPAFQPSASAGVRRDTILVFNNAASGLNKSPAATYYYFTNSVVGGWRKVGAPASLDFGSSNVLGAAEGFIVRKANGVAGPTTTSIIAPFTN